MLTERLACGWRIRKNLRDRPLFLSREPESSPTPSGWPYCPNTRTRLKLFSAPELAPTTGPQRYDVSPDGKWFVTLKTVEPAANEIRIVENWYEEVCDRE